MANKTAAGLVRWAQEWIGRPYWYGTACYHCTESLLAAKTKQYPAHYTPGRMSRYRKDIANGMWAADCIGLAKGYMWWDDTAGKTRYATNGCPDKSANGMQQAARVGGDISTLPERPGVMLWKDGHVGIYIGNGQAVEARGFAYGIVCTQVSARGWQRWFEMPGCDYSGTDNATAEEKPKADGVCVTGNSVNLRVGPGTGYKSVGTANKGDILERAEGISCDGWRAVRHTLSIGGALTKAVCWISAKYSGVADA